MSLYVLESPWNLFFFLNLSWNVLNFYDDWPGKWTENVLECPGKNWNLKKFFEWAPCLQLTTLLTYELLHRYFSTSFYPSTLPPPCLTIYPHVLNTCGKPWDIYPLGRWEILLRGEFLCGGGNLRRSDFDHSNLF